MFKKIVCATDFTDAAGVATRYAASIARAFDVPLDVIHAWDGVAELPSAPESHRTDVIAASRKTDHEKLDALVADLASWGVRATGALIEGAPERAVPEYAAQRGADLIVVGTLATTGLTHALLGSVAERILRTSTVPVLVVPKTVFVAVDALFAPASILVPTDLSTASGDAVKLAVALGRRCIARVATLHAWEVPPYFFEGGEVLKETERRIPEHVRAWMEETFGDEVPEVESLVRRGETHQVLAETCKERQPDLVVMATAGRVGLEHFMLGSVTERAVRTLGRPVLTLRRPWVEGSEAPVGPVVPAMG